MMGLTFLIGFFVAAVIKLIAYAADSFDFYSSHKLELIRLHRWRQHRQKVEKLVRQIPFEAEEVLVKTSVVVSTVTLPVTPVIIMV